MKGSELEKEFRAAVDVIQNIPKDAKGGQGIKKPSNTVLLKFYALFKQATEGKNKTPKPGMFKMVARMKWMAWDKLGDMSKEEAMTKYLAEIVNVAGKDWKDKAAAH